jgi:hypothetical protein
LARLPNFCAGLLGLAAFSATLQAGSINLAWSASPDPLVAGYEIFYGEASGAYTSLVNAGSNLTATVAGLSPGVTYYFAAASYFADGDESLFSNEVTNRLPILPSIIVEPLSQTVLAGLPVTLTVVAGGDPPLHYQWLQGVAPIAGATNSFLSWPQIGGSNAGMYSVMVSDPWGSTTSAEATLTVLGLGSPLILIQPQSQTVVVSNSVSFSPVVTGTGPLAIQWYNGRAAIAGATNSTLSWAQVADYNAGAYSFSVSNFAGVVNSSLVRLIVIDPPSILTQPRSQTVVVSNPASFSPVLAGSAPLAIQWYNGKKAIAGATNRTLSWAQVADGHAGGYSFSVSNLAGVVNSALARLTVIDPPSILTQPQSQSATVSNAASFSSVVIGSAPLSIQWYDGGAAVAGATSNGLAWSSVAASNAGNYYFTVSNVAGAVTSSVAALTVLPTNTMASVAGTYNGLFFQTNSDGTPEVTETTAGLLGNCVVASNGAYSAKLYLGGASYSLSGIFSSLGNTSATIPLANESSSNITVVMHLDLFNGTQQMTGSVSSAMSGMAWCASLMAELATNAFPLLETFEMVIPAGSSGSGSANYGSASGMVVNGVLTLTGALADGTALTQTVPVSKDGNVPLYFNLYDDAGLLEGWINLASGRVTGSLTLIRPVPSTTSPGGFVTVAQVAGATTQQ